MIGSILAHLPLAAGFTWFQLLPGIGDASLGETLHMSDPAHVWVVPTVWVACFAVIGLALAARGSLARAMAKEGPERFIPDSGFSPRALLEVFVESFYGLVESTVGKKEAKVFFPLSAGLFLYIVTLNLMGLVPGTLPATEVFSNNLAMAITVFVVFNYAGLTRNGFAYVKHLWGPIFLMGFLLFPIELLGLFIRPFSLTVRLTANLFADHLVVGTFRRVGGDYLGLLGSLLIPVPFYALGLFVCILQGFVFSLLTTVYVGMSTADMSHGHDDGHGDGHDSKSPAHH
jgi:F-type H+-transporting ATPase subunit a